MMLANLLRDNPNLHAISKPFGEGGQGSPVILLVLLGLAVGVGAAYAWWKRVQRQKQCPSSGRLLKMLAEPMGMTPAHCRVLRQLAWSAGWEPATALLSPELLGQLLQAGRARGIELTAEQDHQVGQILDLIAAASVADDTAEEADVEAIAQPG